MTFTAVSVQPLNADILRSVMPHEIRRWQGIFKPYFQPKDSGHGLALSCLPQTVLAACLHPYNPLLAAAQTKAEDSNKPETFTRLFSLNWCNWQLVFSCCK